MRPVRNSGVPIALISLNTYTNFRADLVIKNSYKTEHKNLLSLFLVLLFRREVNACGNFDKGNNSDKTTRIIMMIFLLFCTSLCTCICTKKNTHNSKHFAEKQDYLTVLYSIKHENKHVEISEGEYDVCFFDPRWLTLTSAG